MAIDVPFIWAIIIAFGIMMYVALDGFDLGIGLLFPFVRAREDRDVMIGSVSPVWDGNETWLVLGGAGLFAAFPLAYGVILSALYLPVMLMLAGLIWRGVSFEFRIKASPATKNFWDGAFSAGAYVATFSQGVALGAFINGFKLDRTTYIGGAFDCFTPFSVFVGFALMFAYSLLGATWLIMKTTGPLEQRVRFIATVLSPILLVTIAAVSVWTPLTHPEIARRWFGWPNIAIFSPVPFLILLLTALELLALAKGWRSSPFFLALFIMFVGYSGLGISLWPYIIPSTISIWSAAGPASSTAFALVGTLFIIPIILVYSSWSYYVFRGKAFASYEQ